MIKAFISDLHLEKKRPSINQLFFSFLNKCIKNVDTLYILGDFFEVWIGDDDINDFHNEVISQLKKATEKGLTIYFMHGNRDFLIGKRFLKKTGCQLLPDEKLIKISDVPTLLMHGDTLCIEDKAYLNFRKKARNWFFQQLFLWKSLKKRRQIANRYRETSKAYTSTAPAHLMDVTQSEVERVMKKHQVNHLIHGHTHRPFIHYFQLNSKPASRIVLGPWHEKGSVLIYKHHNKPQLLEFTQESLSTLFA